MRLKSRVFAKAVLLGFALVGVNIGVNASTISPWSSHADEITLIDNENVDTLRIRPANASGISYNRFNTFSVSGQPLQLLNIPGELEDSTVVEPASLIVIMANDITLNGAVEVLGTPADVLFISEDNESGSIKCANCSFGNIPRITMATARGSIGDSTSSIGELSTTDGSISINGMDAPGALILEVLSAHLNINGTIDLQQPVDKVSGGFTPSDSGKYLLGTGMVNAIVGIDKWDYTSQRISEVYYNFRPTEPKLLEGKIQSAAVKLTTGDCFLLETNIDTTSDFLSSVRYGDKILLSGESITVQSFGDCTTKIEGDIKSDGDIAFKSNSDLLFPIANSNIEGLGLKAIAKGRIENRADLFAHDLELAGNEFVNFGQLEGGKTLAVWADKNVYNQFGGRLTGGTVDVQSESGFVRNGSRTPYLAPESSVDDLLEFVSDDLILTASETSELGTYYRNGVNVSTTHNYSQPADTSAQIHGQRVRIKTKGFENINPYWEQVPDTQYTLLMRSRVNQTVVAGEDSLEVEAANYILNSSAILRTNNKDGGMRLEAPYITNERYRNLTLLDRNFYSSTDSLTLDTETQETIDSRSYTYSPPGIIVSLGDLETYTSKGLVNNASYLEIFGDATFTSGVLNSKGDTVVVGRVNDYGIAHKGISKTTIDKFDLCVGSSNLPRGFDIICTGQTGPDTQIVINDARYADSLFFIHGNVSSNADFESLTLNTFDGFQDLAVAALYKAHAPDGWGDYFYYHKQLYGDQAFAEDENNVPVLWGTMSNQTFTTNDKVTNDTLQLFWTHEWYFDVIESNGCSGSSSCIPFNVTDGERSKTESKEFSLFAVMKDAYESLKSTIANFFAEFDWWS
ncbi:hypothetical protein [Microbulbifer epialgicus]|uniref:Filamentous hemagglutinin family N-terminal domain-containing protein n=1 Tax=Microbulbifer epialgicus TaxID=393907 RepID=A0ABV4P319_9GAMM